MISDIEMESNTNNNGQFVFRVDDKVDNETCTANTGSWTKHIINLINREFMNSKYLYFKHVV